MMTCAHCGQPLVSATCPDCRGYGGHWQMNQQGEWIDPAPACTTCGGAGRKLKCLDHLCEGSRWPLTSTQRAESGEREKDGDAA